MNPTDAVSPPGTDRADRADRAGLRHRVSPWALALLTAVWVMLWSDGSVANVLAGAAIAVVLLVAFPLPRGRRGWRVRPWALLVLLARFQVDLVVAGCQVAYACVAPWRRPVGRFVRVPLRGPEDLTRVLTAEFTSLVPGSLVVDLDRESGELTVHLFDAPDEAAGTRGVAHVLEQEARVLRALSRPEVRS